jgi:hypothetical protein
MFMIVLLSNEKSRGLAMHKVISAIIVLALYSVSVNAFSASGKQQLCHKGKQISVAQSAVSAHQNHGDTEGECEDESPVPEPVETSSAVIIMRCDAGDVVSITTSLDVAVILPIPLEDGADCATALAKFLDVGFRIRSITGGSAGNSLYTDYLLIGEVPVDS